MVEMTAGSPPPITEIEPNGILSFAMEMEPIALGKLNVLIGPNGSGKSNLIELLELFRAAPTDLGSAIRKGGGVSEWIWKGDLDSSKERRAHLALTLNIPKLDDLFQYEIAFTSSLDRFHLVRERIKSRLNMTASGRPSFFYNSTGSSGTVESRHESGTLVRRRATFDGLDPNQSILAQRKDPDTFPEFAAIEQIAGRIEIYREWTIGPYSALRYPQPADSPNDVLLPTGDNLGLVLNAMSAEQGDAWDRLNEVLRRFLPRYRALSTKVAAGTVQILLHENGLRSPVPATRVSDGTMRFIALAAVLLRPEAASVICIEEPELGLHPDALRLVAELLVSASARTQLIVTTQSDVLVSALTDVAESVLVCENLTGTQIRRLEAEKLKFWLKDYQLGDIWRMGELGGNP